MSRNQLKCIAIIAMLIDHIAWAFFPFSSPLAQICHFIGRITGPVMMYFVAEGYRHTSNLANYIARMTAFATVSWVPYIYFKYGTVVQPDQYVICGNVIFTLLLGLLAILVTDQVKSKFVAWLTVLLLCMLSLESDYGVVGVLLPVLFYHLGGEDVPLVRRRIMWVGYFAVILCGCVLSPMISLLSGQSAGFDAMYCFGFVLPPLLLLRYNGKAGASTTISRWGFYAFYPVHLLILGLLQWVVFA